jgi:hypothetical protein
MKSALVTCIFLAGAVLSVEACNAAAKQALTTCTVSMQSTLSSRGGASCSVLDEYFACMEKGASGCLGADKTDLLQDAKTQSAALVQSFGLGHCGGGSGKEDSTPKPAPTPASSPVPASCASLDLPSKMTECMTPLMQGASSGNLCGAWSTFECCLVDSVASCGESMQDEVKTMLASTRDSMKGQALFKALDTCAAATCHPAAPAMAETTLMATISFEDPGKFDLEKYIVAAKKHTGASTVKAVLKSLEVLVKYVVPMSDTMSLSKVKAAIAKANSVEESQVSLETNGTQRLTVAPTVTAVTTAAPPAAPTPPPTAAPTPAPERLLSAQGLQGLLAESGTSLAITISVSDAKEAAAVKKTAVDVKSLESELGVQVSISEDPVTIAKVETVLTSDPSMSDTLRSKLEKAGGDIGGTVVVAEIEVAVETSSASSLFTSALAPLMVLVAIAVSTI